MVYLNLLNRLRADVECGNKEAHAADLHKANEWIDMAKAARKKKADGAAAASTKTGQRSTDTPPPR